MRCIVAIGLLLRLVYALSVRHHLLQQIDPLGYHLLATHLLEGRGFCLYYAADLCLPNLVRTPVYPAFIAFVYQLTGAHPFHVVLVQIALDTVTCWLAAWCSYRLTRSQRVMLATAALYALNPNAWLFAGALLTETVLAFILTALFALGLCAKDRHDAPFICAAIGLLCALALLTKPNVILLPAMIAVCLALWRVRWRWIGLMIGVCGLCVAPWLMRNQRLVGEPVLSTAFIDNMNRVSAVATLFYVRGEQEGHPFTAAWDAVYHADVIAAAGARYGWTRPIRSAHDLYVQMRDVQTVAGEIIVAHPAAFLQAHWDGFIRAWQPHEHRVWYQVLTGNAWNDAPSVNHTWLAHFLHLFWWGVHLLGRLFFVTAVWHYRKQAGLLISVVGGAVMITAVAGVLADMRFRFPIAPQLAIFISIGMMRLSAFRHHRGRHQHR